MNAFLPKYKRQCFTLIHDVRSAPSSGDVTFKDQSNIFFNLKCLPNYWFDPKNSYITCDLEFTITRIGPEETDYDIHAGLDRTSFALFKKLRVYINDTLCEDLDDYNLLHPTLQSFNNNNNYSSSLYATGIQGNSLSLDATLITQGTGLRYLAGVGQMINRNINITDDLNYGCYFESIPGFIEQDTGTPTAESSTNITGAYDNLTLLLPSPLVGIYAKQMLPVKYFKSVKIEIKTESPEIALGASLAAKNTINYTNTAGTLNPTNLNPKPSRILCTGTATYTIFNLNYYQRYIEIDGEILNEINNVYETSQGITFSIPVKMYKHRQQSFPFSIGTFALNFKFSIDSAIHLIAIFRPAFVTQSNINISAIPAADRVNPITPPAFNSLTYRFSPIKSYKFTINGNEFPDTGEYITINGSVQTNTNGTITNAYDAIVDLRGNSIMRVLNCFNKSSNNKNNFSSINLRNYLSKFGATAYPQFPDYDDNFVIGYSFEPSNAIGSNYSSGTSLTALNDLTFHLYNALNTSTFSDLMCDIFVFHEAEILFSNGVVTYLGGQ